MNTIAIDQNDRRQIERLAAQRSLYATAKAIFGWQSLFSGPLTVALAFAVLAYPQFKGYAALWGIALSLLDVVWLTPWQRRLRDQAARIQELFDCDVLGLPWDDLKGGSRPDPELVNEQARKYEQWAASMPPLTDWYPTSIGGLPLHVARLVCQRSNCWWDAKQRRRYAVVVGVCLGVVCVGVLLMAMRSGFSMEDFVMRLAAPLSPAVILGYRQISEQLDAAARVDALKRHAEALWAQALAGRPEHDMSAGARQLQGEILEHRRRSPLVFDAVFRRLRRDYEIQMNQGASELVAEASKQKGASLPSGKPQ